MDLNHSPDDKDKDENDNLYDQKPTSDTIYGSNQEFTNEPNPPRNSSNDGTNNPNTKEELYLFIRNLKENLESSEKKVNTRSTKNRSEDVQNVEDVDKPNDFNNLRLQNQYKIIERTMRYLKLSEGKYANMFGTGKKTKISKEKIGLSQLSCKQQYKGNPHMPPPTRVPFPRVDAKSRMEWMLVNPQIHSMFASLGSFVQDIYVINPECLLTLDEIWRRLTVEDGTLRTFRRAIGLSQVVKKDFLPLLINCKDDDRITDLTIKILAYLTMPIECLLPMEVMLKTDAGRNTIYELNMFLSSCKEAFLDPRATKRVIDHIKSILDQVNNSRVKSENFNVLNDSVTLLRNILHIPELKHGSPLTTTQNQILWNLFAQNIDKVVIELMVSESRSCLGLALVQLIALMYKDQHVPTLQKLLNLWFETSFSESSEDNESNTSPPERDFGDSSSSMTTSDPTSDSSDNNMGESRMTENDFKDNQPQQHNHHSQQLIHGHQQSHIHHNQHQGHSHHSQQQSHNHHNKPQHGNLMQQHSHKHHSQQHSHVHQSLSLGHHNQQKCHSGNKGHVNQKKNNSNSRNKSSKQNNKKQMDTSSSGTCSDKQLHIRPGSSQHQQMGGSFSQPHYQPVVNDKAQHTPSQPSQTQKKIECMSEHSDCGYGTQLETQESISTSSNDDDSPDRDKKPVHQKPSNMIQKARQSSNKTLTVQEKEALRRKKLNRRRRLSSVKALLHHSPSDDDITHLLKEFTVDFLLKGYSSLVTELHCQLLLNSQAKTHMDSSHFFWLITYFLKFATQLEIDLEHISPVLSGDILFYLTYEGVMLCEQFELAKTKQSDYELLPCVRRMHLVVTAIRELIQAIETYKKISHQNEEDQLYLNKIQRQICGTEDIRCLFVLMLRQFNPSLQSEQFLKDLVVTNHTLLAFIENINPHPSLLPLFQSHIKQFAHADVMKQYGLLLEKFQENGQHVNDCIFTMMHHIAADQEGVATLFQPSILKTFSLICESDFQLCDDWSDLIEFVINKFIKTPKPVTLLVEQKVICNESLHTARVQPHQGWTEEDCHNLYWYYVQSASSSDPVGSVIKLYDENGVVNKTRIEVIEKLLQQDIITRFQYQELLEKEPIATIKESGWDDEDDVVTNIQPPDEIETLRNHLIKINKSELVFWVQKVLLEACNAKLALMKKSNTPVEPIPFYSTLIEEGIPLVAWNCDQSAIMQYQPFILLLHKLGLHLPADAGKAFARIPHFWPPELLFSTAKKLGPINPNWLKFDCKAVEGGIMDIGCLNQEEGVTTFLPNTATYFTYTPKPNIGANWMEVARHSKVANSTNRL